MSKIATGRKLGIDATRKLPDEAVARQTFEV
jgi:3-polyprenyl-4-hydroxybenzoate decarboxylase